jgi:RNA polymerase sigma-70 factor, ECF subfamily
VNPAAAIMDARPRVIAALAGHFRDLDAAEDGFADAAEALLRLTPASLPANIGGWLYVTAKRRLLDGRRRALRHGDALTALTPLIEESEEMGDILAFPDPIPDDRLRLIFTVCHPAIAPDIRIALALRVICGVPVERIADALLIAAPTLHQRLVRAKAKIRVAGIAFETPARSDWPGRLEAVLTTLEIGYTLAYQDGAAALDADLSPEIARLTGLLVDLLPDEPELLGLAATIAFAEARRAARIDADGAMIPLSRQDAALWDGAAIQRGHALMQRAAQLARSGPRQIGAAIQMTHARRGDEEATDWPAILRLYDALLLVRPGPVVAVARAMAVAQVDGAAAGLALLDAIPPASVAHHRPWHSARAHLLGSMGRDAEARDAYQAALALAPPPAERLYLEQQMRRTTPAD